MRNGRTNRTTYLGSLFVLSFLVMGIFAHLVSAEDASEFRQSIQIRGTHNGDSNDFTGVKAVADSGMNSIFVSMGGHLTSMDGAQPVEKLSDSAQLAILNQWQSETAAHHLQFFPMVELFGTGDRKRWPPERALVTRAGERLANTPCPNDPDLWEKRLGDTYVEIAKWAVSIPNVPGIIMDTEMYGGDKTGFHDACFCDACRKEIAEELKIDPSELNLDNEAALARYREISTNIVQKHAENLRKRVHEVYPNCILGGYLLDYAIAGGIVPPIYKGMTLGWGTAENSVLVFSEATYDYGFNTIVKDGLAFHGDEPGHLRDWEKRWKEWGAHAEMVGGLWISRIPPENVAENIYHLGVSARGYWIYDLIHLASGPRSDFFALPGEGASEYWPQIALGNAELDKHAAQGDGYTSALEARPFTLPAPGIDLTRWKPLELPQLLPVRKSSEFRFYGQEQIFYLSAKVGDKVRFTVVANDIATGRKTPKKDAVAIVIVDPSGKIIQRDKFTVENLDTKPLPDSRFDGRRQIEFQPDATGDYCVFLKGIRYAYNLGESSHPWAALIPTDRPSNLWQVRRFHVKPLADATQVKINLTLGRESKVSVRDASGKQLAQRNIAPDDVKGLLVPLPAKRPTSLTVVIDGDANGTISVGEGMEPWISASPFK